ncbi:toll-like receptor Tollo isoform X2 [Littorina saxatilis]
MDYDPITTELNLWNYLPRDWSSMCTVDHQADPDVNATITCDVKAGDEAQWRLVDLRSSLTSLVESTGLEVAVNLQCEDGGSVSLPFPWRSPGLVKLTVYNCRMLDKYGDFATPAQNLGDWLRVVDIRNSVWINNPAHMENVMNNIANFTSHYECGQDSTMVSYIYRNVSDESSLKQLALDEHENGAEKVLTFLLILDKINNHCNYEKLEVQDESHSPTTSRNHFEFMVKDATFPNLRLLNYSSIGMTEVPLELRESRQKFPGSKLGVIDLTHNKIHQVGNIPPYPSYGINTTLILQFNNITEINMAMFEAWASVSDFLIDIRNNPIDCNCEMSDLLRALQNDSRWVKPAMAQYRRHLSIMTCATPLELEGHVIGSLSVSDLPCFVAGVDLKPAMAALVVVVVILLVLLIVAVKYRKEVRILMYTRVHIVLPCGPPSHTSADAPEKAYDAFVSYAHEDSDWVLGSLLKRLEEPSNARGCGPVKLCIHQRDFVVGKPIIDNIIDSIAASRHTIIVLSKNFVKSRWAMEELQQAYRQSMEERRCHLVVVVLESVPQSDMAPVLRRCCKTFTYLESSDSLFWDRLLYSLQVDDISNSRDSKTGKGPRTASTTSDEYDDIADREGNKESKRNNCDLANGDVVSGEIKEDSALRKALFLENMRMSTVPWTALARQLATLEWLSPPVRLISRGLCLRPRP